MWGRVCVVEIKKSLGQEEFRDKDKALAPKKLLKFHDVVVFVSHVLMMFQGPLAALSRETSYFIIDFGSR
jgi:hypothetical protein